MEPNDVLQQYIEFCNSPTGFFQYSLAKNSILEWFGRTIRGRNQIYQYFRYDLCQQYEHNFYDAHFCEPIEVRSTHYETKKVVTDFSNIANKSQKTNTSEITPIEFVIVTPELPKLNRGLKFVADSNEKELNELGLSPIYETIATPPQQLYTERNMNEPPIKRYKHSICSESIEKNIDNCLEKTNIDEDRNINDFKKSCTLIPDTKYLKEEYSPLMYIEVNGTLRILNRIKHRGVKSTTLNSSLINKSDLNNSNDLLNSSSYWDRDTKLKISYRIKLLDKQIEFALIIYEHITRKPTTKRNLLLEFEESMNDKNNKNEFIKKETIPNIKKDDNISLELKRKKPLKRLLRLF